MSASDASFHFHSEGHRKAVRKRLQIWEKGGFNRRLWRRDPTLWGAGHEAEAQRRLGWLDLPGTGMKELDSWVPLQQAAGSRGVDEFVVVGMGGSSLGAGMIGHVFRPDTGIEIQLLDTTHPQSIRALADRLSPRAWLIIATKSGTTIETRCLADYLVDRIRRVGGDSGESVIAVTDPGSPLEAWAADTGVRACVATPPDVGGRFSALSAYGLLPAFLAGADLRPMLAGARAAADDWRSTASEEANQPLKLGAFIGELARAGRDKLYVVVDEKQRRFGAWLEQLLAESLGKSGRGVVPIICEAPADPARRTDGQTVVFRDVGVAAEPGAITGLEHGAAPDIVLPATTSQNVGAEILRWEIATVAMADVLGVTPFDQPDVQLSKRWTQRLIDASGVEDSATRRSIARSEFNEGEDLLPHLLDHGEVDYLALQAYLAPTAESNQVLEELAMALGRHLGCPVTIAYGPRYLHSTGQLHKGGPADVLCLQLVDDEKEDLPIPGRDFTFRELLNAQADGDLEALAECGRAVHRIRLGSRPLESLRTLLNRLK